MRKVFIIGIGAGNPEHVTVQAINALNKVDVFFIPDKGDEKSGLREGRRAICERYIKDRTYRFVDIKTPERAKEFTDYRAVVGEWHAKIEANYQAALTSELSVGQCGAFLVWGDPALYDSTLRIIERLRSRMELDFEMIPGISSIQALAAKHRIPLNRIGEAVTITPARRLKEGLPADPDSVVVVLDGEQTFNSVDADAYDIYWGANLGTDREILISGKLSEVKADIERKRAQARRKDGWIMDTYLLRKRKER